MTLVAGNNSFRAILEHYLDLKHFIWINPEHYLDLEHSLMDNNDSSASFGPNKVPKGGKG